MSADIDTGHELVAHGADKIASFADVNGFRHAAARLLTVADDMRGADAPGRDRFAHIVFTLVYEINAARMEERGDVAVGCLLSLLDRGPYERAPRHRPKQAGQTAGNARVRPRW